LKYTPRIKIKLLWSDRNIILIKSLHPNRVQKSLIEYRKPMSYNLKTISSLIKKEMNNKVQKSWTESGINNLKNRKKNKNCPFVKMGKVNLFKRCRYAILLTSHKKIYQKLHIQRCRYLILNNKKKTYQKIRFLNNQRCRFVIIIK